MDKWYILQIILDIYLCGFVVYYMIAYRKKEYDLLKQQRVKEESEITKIQETLKGYLETSEAASKDMIDAFQNEHHAIKQSINYINLKMDELNKAVKESERLLNAFKEEVPTTEIRERQNQIKYAEAKELLQKGFSPIVVSEKMKLPIGEVDLLNKVYFHKNSTSLTL